MSDEITGKIIEFINTKIKESKPNPAIEAFKITASVLASLATLVAAVFAFIASQQAISVKSELDRRQLLLDENARIGVIFNKTGGDEGCSGLPLDEDEMWQEYRACLLGEQHRFNNEASFKSNQSFEDRLRCLKKEKIAYCKIEKPNNSMQPTARSGG